LPLVEGSPTPVKPKRQGSMIEVGNPEGINPAGKAIAVEAWVNAEKPGGVVLASGGANHGYSLYLRNGRPHFAVRANSKLAVAAGKQRVVGRWVHLAGTLTHERSLRLYVNGKPVASAPAPSLITVNPAEGMQIGTDIESLVGDYAQNFNLTGILDEVKVFQWKADSKRLAQGSLVLSYTFEDGNAADVSGNKAHGTPTDVVSAAGRNGKGMKFTGAPRGPADYLVDLHWTQDLPLHARAIVLAGDKIILAGPDDLVNEEEAMKKVFAPEVRRQMADQVAALRGEKGALLWIASTVDGKKVAQYRLDSPPVFDGMAAANRKLYVTTLDGHVQCLGR